MSLHTTFCCLLLLIISWAVHVFACRLAKTSTEVCQGRDCQTRGYGSTRHLKATNAFHGRLGLLKRRNHRWAKPHSDGTDSRRKKGVDDIKLKLSVANNVTRLPSQSITTYDPPCLPWPLPSKMGDKTRICNSLKNQCPGNTRLPQTLPPGEGFFMKEVSCKETELDCHQRQAAERIMNLHANTTRSGVCVFDLDETLLTHHHASERCKAEVRVCPLTRPSPTCLRLANCLCLHRLGSVEASDSMVCTASCFSTIGQFQKSLLQVKRVPLGALTLGACEELCVTLAGYDFHEFGLRQNLTSYDSV